MFSELIEQRLPALFVRIQSPCVCPTTAAADCEAFNFSSCEPLLARPAPTAHRHHHHSRPPNMPASPAASAALPSEDVATTRAIWALTLCDWCGPGAPDTGLPFGPACRRLWCICCHWGRLQAYALNDNCLLHCLSLPFGFGFLLIAWRRRLIRDRCVRACGRAAHS